jgi:CMP-N,N'-diacetyllegionaminic acid synthase
MAEIIGLITARGGSKRLPGKNIKSVAGKPMIAWTIEAAEDSGQCSRILVSTEDDKIAYVSSQWGAEIIDEPQKLAEDNILMIDVIVHAINELGLAADDYILLLQPTSPVRTGADIKEAVRIMKKTKSEAVVSTTNGMTKPNGAIYLNRVNSLLSTRTFYPEGRTVWYSMPPERSVDVDEQWQLEVAECMLRRRILK